MAQRVPNKEEHSLLLHKGIYPYEYMDTWEHFTDPLPP